MQDPTTFQPFKPQLPEQEQLKCPRCDSSNTKFCYYNNYNLSQPRHFCKSCRRYWTKGGALRNIPIGGGTRKNSKKASTTFKRPSSSSSSSSSISSLSKAETILPIFTQPLDSDRHMLDITGSFSSLLSSNGRFGNLLGGFNSPNSIQFGDFTEHSNSSSVENPALELLGTNNGDGFLGLQGGGGGDSSCWDGANGWPDLAIHTPGSGFH